MKKICRLAPRNLLLLGVICVLALYIITLVRIDGYLRKHQSSIFALIEENYEAELGKDKKVSEHTIQSFHEKKPVSPVFVKKEFLEHAIQEKMEPVCTVKHHPFFPLCGEKMQFIKAMWQSHCFEKVHNVDGSGCSLIRYMTEVEPFCASDSFQTYYDEFATPRFDLDGLLSLMPGHMFTWMRERAKQLWDDWVEAGKWFLNLKQKWKKKKVVAFLGSMGFQPHIMLLAGKGGPLGELVQWTDLIAGLYILGYDIQVTLNATELSSLDSDDKNGCAAKPTKKLGVDVIYTDVNGIILIAQNKGYASSGKYRCTYRILDSFGTYPEFNYPAYPHKIPGGRSDWANHNLLPMQFLTLYPHTQDNSFLGFVVGSNEKVRQKTVLKKDKALLYAKLSYYFEAKELVDYLKIISEYFEIHATTVGGNIPSFIINHGAVSGSKVQEMLLESKLFIGVGFPYEGPGPMEAMASGTVFLQPKYDEPKSKLNDDFFKDKPILRKLTSQSPYMEEFVGEPYCYTIDIKNEKLLRSTLQHIQQMEPLPPKIPKEFTNKGMLERIHVFTEHMDYCHANAPRWPPIDHLQVFVSERGQSCKNVCMSKGLVCERTYFDDINTRESIERYSNITCSSVKPIMNLHPPSYDPVSNICFLQEQGMLYSCMHEEINFKRLCACRDYEHEQVALCKGCL